MWAKRGTREKGKRWKHCIHLGTEILCLFLGESGITKPFYALIVAVFKHIYSYIKIQSSSIHVSKWKDLYVKRKKGQFYCYNLKNKIVNQGKNKNSRLVQVWKSRSQWVNTEDSEKKVGRRQHLGIVNHFLCCLKLSKKI